MMPEALLTIEDLCVDFTSGTTVKRAVHHLSLTVHKGEILAIVGESGSGKSVTALSILQLLPPSATRYASGKIVFDQGGQPIDLLKAPEAALMSIRGQQIAMIFQEPMTALNPVLTCGFQVVEAIRQHQYISEPAAKAKSIELFRQVQLPDPENMYHRYPHQLSGGQKQRVMIAIAMSCEPALLVCDEPTTALDVTVQKNTLQLLRNLQLQNNMGVIFITHDLGVVASIADRVAVMYRGKLVETQKTRQLFEQPLHPYTKALLACRPALHPKGKPLPVVSDFMDTNEQDHGYTKSATAPTYVASASTNTIHEPSKALLCVDELGIWYPGKKSFFGKPMHFVKAVDGVSFNVLEGETLGLVGESGCGKTTLGRALLGLAPVHAGTICYRGIDLVNGATEAVRAMRREMQLIFQDPYGSLNPRLRIGDAIAEPMKVHGLVTSATARKEKVIHLLEQVNLTADHYNRYPHEFSGGQRQRIVIARALAMEPAFIVCDESVSALDVSVQAQVLNLLNDLKKAFGFTAIFISHDLSVVRYISDRIMVMQKGQIVETGEAEAIYQRPQNAYTRELLDAIPDLALSQLRNRPN